MVYKYQKETIEYLKETVERLETLTEKRMSLKIGYMRDEFWNGSNWYELRGDLYLRINSDTKFSLEEREDDYLEFFKEIGNIDDCSYVEFDENILLNINEFIEKIYEEKKEREEFHRRLNSKLKCLNECLGRDDKNE